MGIGLPNLGLTGDIPDHFEPWGATGRANDRRLDALVMASVKSVLSAPPGSPADGDRYLIGASPTGAWAGQAGSVAQWNATLSTWVFYAPKPGWGAYLESARAAMRYAGGAWFTDDLAVNVKGFGATGDGTTDDTAAVLAAFVAVPAGARLHFPAGTYRLASWSVYALTKRLWLSGDGEGNTIIKGTAGASFIAITADHRCSDMTLDTWDIAFNFSGVTTTLDRVLFDRVEVKNYRRAIYGEGSVGGSGVRNFAVNASHFFTGTSYAILLDLPITDRAYVTDCTIKDCVNRAIALGDNTLVFADDRGNYVVTGNLIDGVTNGAGPPTNTTAAIAIICYGWRAVIADNIVRNVSKLDPTATDTDGIYTKCRYTVVANNVLIDAGQGEAFLNIKGGARNELVAQPYGYAVVVVNNVCLDAQVNPTFLDTTFTPLAVTVDAGTNVFTTPGAHGLVVGNRVVFDTAGTLPGGLSSSTAYHVVSTPTTSTFTVSTTSGGAVRDITSAGSGAHTVTKASAFKRTNGVKIATSDVVVAGNLFDGLTEIAIYTDSDTGASHPNHNVVISDNFIVNHRGKAAMSIYGRGDRIRVIDNLIDGVLNQFVPTSQGFGIDINKKEGTGLDIVGNRVYNVVNATNSVGVSLSPGALDKTVSADHTIDTFTATASHLGAPIAHTFAIDDRLQFTTLGALPTGLALATWYKVESIPTLNTFTLKDDVSGVHIAISDNGTDELTAFKQVAFASWRIADNQINGAKYGVQFNWDPTYLTVDDVLVRHNTGRNINGNVIPVLADLVKYSDTPTNLIDIPARAETVRRVNDNEAELKNGLELQELKIYGGDDGAGNYERVSLGMTSTEAHLASEAGGTGTANDWFILIGGTKYYRLRTSQFLPQIDNAIDLGSASLNWGTLFLSTLLDLRAGGATRIRLPNTNTTTVGDVTINNISGRAILASGATAVVVTNDRISSASHIFCTLRTADGTNFIKSVVRSGSPEKFTITMNAAAGANLSIDFLVVNF